MKLLITGTAGFIGYHLTKRLASEGHDIVGIDIINDYYDVDLKYKRLAELGFCGDKIEKFCECHNVTLSKVYPNVTFAKMDITDSDSLKSLFEAHCFDMVLHLAAQAGVRYSLTNPNTYISSNVQGFLTILETIKRYPVKHLVYASSSSVYGLNSIQPFSETNAADHPVSLYAVSKRTNELMAHSYSHLYGIPATGLRFFTVYGPYGRPDMAPFLFTKSILEGKPITVFNNGEMQRDFTYVGDIIEGIVRVMNLIPAGNANWDGIQSGTSPAPAKIYNIGNGKPVHLLDFIHTLEAELGVKAEMNFAPMQLGDVSATWADCSSLERDTGYCPGTTINQGIKEFVSWYRGFYL
jgi:UDP-glucuronate 4-epimerase